jgi:hypothetical protein
MVSQPRRPQFEHYLNLYIFVSIGRSLKDELKLCEVYFIVLTLKGAEDYCVNLFLLI